MTIEYDQDYVDLLDRNNTGWYDVRQAWKARLDEKVVELEQEVRRRPAPAEGARRSLPSGPAPSWTGLALSLALLGIAAIGLSVAVVGFVAIHAVQNALSRGGDR